MIKYENLHKNNYSRWRKVEIAVHIVSYIMHRCALDGIICEAQLGEIDIANTQVTRENIIFLCRTIATQHFTPSTIQVFIMKI